MSQIKKIMIIAGEASGEQHAAELVKALKRQHKDREFQFIGIGGDKMRKAGVETFADCRDLSVIGFIDVIKHYPTIRRIFKQTETILKSEHPDLLITIDYPGFNLRLARIAKHMGIKTLHYVSPQVWAWREKRVYKIANSVDHLAVILPFEVDCYKDTNLAVTYVGHPLTHVVKPSMELTEALKTFNIKPKHKVIGLMPGSRKKEIQRMLPVMLDAARLLQLRIPNMQFLIPVASTLDKQFFERYLKNIRLDIQLIEDHNYDVMQVCDAMIVTSGTATLEVGLMAVPMVVIYKASRFAAALMRRLLKTPFVSLCNIVAGKAIIPELLQDNATGEKISHAMLRILQEERYRKNMINELQQMKKQLGNENGSKNVAKIAADMLGLIDAEN